MEAITEVVKLFEYEQDGVIKNTDKLATIKGFEQFIILSMENHIFLDVARLVFTHANTKELKCYGVNSVISTNLRNFPAIKTF